MSLSESLIDSSTQNLVKNPSSETTMSKKDFSLLEEMGFNITYIKKVYSFLKPNSLNEAITLMTEKDGIYQHNFMRNPKKQSHQCYLCGNPSTAHINYNEIKDEEIENSNYDDDDSEEEEEGEENCIICDNYYKKENMLQMKKCKHTYCRNCWLSYIKTKIENLDIKQLKCINYDCKEILPEEFIDNIISNDLQLIQKYEKFKNKLKILNDPTKLFCPIPNCEGYATKDPNNKYIQCTNGHKFCSICMKKEHGNEKCDNILEKEFNIWKKGKKIKQCPKCKIWTEKNEGCNHMTCAECKHEWCWLCNGDYTVDHYYTGKCNGLQFYNSKSDEDINKINQNENNNNNVNINQYIDRLDYYDDYYDRRWENQRDNNWRPALGEVPFSYWDPDGFVDPYHPLDNFEDPMPIKCLIAYIILYFFGNPVLYSCRFFLDAWFGMDDNGVERNVLTFYYCTELILFIIVSLLYMFFNLGIMIIISLPCLFYWPLIRKYKIVWYCCFFVRVMFRNLSDSIFLF